MFEIKKDPKKIIILGSGSGWEHSPQISNKIIYALNDYVYQERYQIKPDLLFIMDVLDEKPQVVAGITNLGDIVSRINGMRIPLIGPYKYEEIPLSQAFPIEACVKEFGMPYFSNTIGYMIAYALLQKVEEIDIYGVNQASSTEYFYEKAGVEYWLGIAIGRGVKVTINGSRSELLTNKMRFGGGILYGYQQTFEQIVQAKEKFGEQMVKKLFTLSQPKSRTVRRVN